MSTKPKTKREPRELPQEEVVTDMPLQNDEEGTEYIVVTDKTSEVMLSTSVWGEASRLAKTVRRAGGEVTIFKSTKG